MSKETAGLSIQEAWNEAMEEEEALMASEESSEDANPPVEESQESDEEQLAVENTDEEGLFTKLASETTTDTEQPSQTDSYKVTVNGETSWVDLEELINGYQRQADYTRSKQQLAAERQEAQSAIALYESLKENPMATVQKLWESVRSGQPLPEPQAQAGDLPENTDIQELVNQKVEEALAADPRIREIEEQKALAEVNAIFAEIEDDYEVTLSENDKVFVLNEATNTNNPDIEAVFAKLWHRAQKMGKQADNVVSNSTSTGYGGKEALPITQAKPKQYSSWREAMNETLAEEGMSAADLDRAISNL